jgi:asparagine synthase (glutamine-hydrolysing)
VCGIAGYAGQDPPGAALVHRMCDRLVHRGPDDDGYLLTGEVALGMRRLAIIDVAAGHQPVGNEDGTVSVVYNGEVYNFPELRAHLIARGHSFRTATDTECIVHLYEDYGDRCVEQLRGMFAFALWDARQRRLLLARDRTGKKPLYYRHTPKGIWFASELKALLADPAMERSVDTRSLQHYLTFGYVPAPRSILAGVAKVPPAHTLSWQGGEVTLRRYWFLSYAAKEAIAEPEAVERVRALIREATRIRLLSERPLGAFLSGGIDSSLVVAAMAEAAPAVKTFSIGFEDPRYDERAYARLVADAFGTQHEELVLNPQRADLVDLLPRLAWHYDEPFADSSAIPAFYLAEMAHAHVVVALTGDGGDESFGGYERYIAQRMAARVPGGGRWAEAARRGVGWLPAGAHRSRTRRVKRFLTFALSPAESRYAETMAIFTPRDTAALFSDAMAEATAGAAPYALIGEAFATSDATDPAEAAMDVDVRTYLPGDLLVKMDIASMAHSLEARSPLLDTKVMEFGASLPATMKVRGRTGKWVLRQAARGWLPDAVADRRKMGFGVPLSAWLRDELRDLARETLTDGTARSRPYFEAATVDRLLEEHENGHDHGAKLWALLSFELWHRTFLDAGGRGGGPGPANHGSSAGPALPPGTGRGWERG